MNIIKIIPILLCLSGCASQTIPTDNLAALPDDDLCLALGENNHNGPLVLRITDEIEKRGALIDQEKCYLISHKAITNNSREIEAEPVAESSTLETRYDPQKKKWIRAPSGTKAGLKITAP